MIAVFSSSGNVPVVSDMLTIYVIVSSTVRSMSFSRFVGIVSNSEVLFFILSIPLSVSNPTINNNIGKCTSQKSSTTFFGADRSTNKSNPLGDSDHPQSLIHPMIPSNMFARVVHLAYYVAWVLLLIQLTGLWVTNCQVTEPSTSNLKSKLGVKGLLHTSMICFYSFSYTFHTCEVPGDNIVHMFSW